MNYSSIPSSGIDDPLNSRSMIRALCADPRFMLTHSWARVYIKIHKKCRLDQWHFL